MGTSRWRKKERERYEDVLSLCQERCKTSYSRSGTWRHHRRCDQRHQKFLSTAFPCRVLHFLKCELLKPPSANMVYGPSPPHSNSHRERTPGCGQWPIRQVHSYTHWAVRCVGLAKIRVGWGGGTKKQNTFWWLINTGLKKSTAYYNNYVSNIRQVNRIIKASNCIIKRSSGLHIPCNWYTLNENLEKKYVKNSLQYV